MVLDEASAVFICWAQHVPRARNLAEALGAKDFYVVKMKDAPKILLPFRYLAQASETLQILRREQPDLILVMSPPVVLPLVVYLYARFTGVTFAIDTHSGVFFGPWARFLPLQRLLSRKACVTLTTESSLRRVVESWGATAFALPDRLPQLPIPTTQERTGSPSVCFVSSFSSDEPLEEVIVAAERMPNCDFYLTGRVPDELPMCLRNKPLNVTLTGFLSDEEYVKLLNKVDVVMALVKTESTLLCAAYEAVQLRKPLVTSATSALRGYFTRGSVFVDNSPQSIVDGVRDALTRKDDLCSEMGILRVELAQRWERDFGELVSLLESCRPGSD